MASSPVRLELGLDVVEALPAAEMDELLADNSAVVEAGDVALEDKSRLAEAEVDVLVVGMTEELDFCVVGIMRAVFVYEIEEAVRAVVLLDTRVLEKPRP